MTIVRRLGLGRLTYKLWFAPRAFVRRCRKQGPLHMALAAHGHRQMKAAARASFAPVVSAPTNTLNVHFLTGHRYWHQTLFCARSLLRVTKAPIKFVIIDDGSLQQDERERLSAGLCQTKIISISEEVLDHRLPESRFPALRARRKTYAHLRKLTDIHAGQVGWKLVCDSDMLFLREPEAMLDWLTKPTQPCHLTDVENAYGYSACLMTRLVGHPIAPRVNVGVCGLKSDALDWDRLEYWCKLLIEEEGMKYLLEQALSAMLMSNQNRTTYDQNEYIVAPSRTQTRDRIGTLHHYTAESKEWYYRFGWKNIAASDRATPALG